MSPQTKKKAMSFTVTAGAILSAIAWGIPKAAPIADQHWVRADTFIVFRQALARQHLLDSVSYREDIRDLIAIAKGIDSVQKCDHGAKAYCRYLEGR